MLVILNNFIITYLVDRLALANENISFDVITPPKKYQPITNNVNSIRLDNFYPDPSVAFPPMNAIASYALSNHYDYILTFSNFLQNHKDFTKTTALMFDTYPMLESDKLFTKNLLTSIDIPTPSYRIVDRNEIKQALDKTQLPIVFKISKSDYRISSFGTSVFHDRSYNVDTIINRCDMDQVFYTEDFIEGRELSMHFLCNGTDWVYMGEARDYKKLHDGDTGINTDGIGCYSPIDYAMDIKEVVFEYMNKLMAKLNSMGIYYKGIMYLGVIISDSIPYILEINTRPGFPEIATICDRLDGKILLQNFINAAKGEPMMKMEQNDLVSVCVLIHHKNYSLDNIADSSVYPVLTDIPSDITVVYAEPALFRDNIYCALIANGKTKKEAADTIYNWISTQKLKDYTVRKDIGYLD